LRHSRTAAIVLATALAAALGGCGGSGPQSPNAYGNTLTIYTALPTSGPQYDEMVSIEDGEYLALGETHTIVAGHAISLAPLSDASQSAGGWDTTDAYNDAKNATQNLDAIAYIGDFDSAATATSLPVTNADDMLQVSPASPYIGLTDANPYDDKGEPASYYPNGTRTFARLVPTDIQEAAATANFMRSLDVSRLYVLSDVAPSAYYDSAIAPMVAADAQKRGIALAGSAQVNTVSTTQAAGYASVVHAIAASHANAVLVGAQPDVGAEALWQELYAKLPSVRLFAPSTLATNPFLNSLGPAASVTYVTSPILPINQYPAARKVLRLYQAEFSTPPTQWSLYGYEAMESVLQAIRDAGGKHADDRLDIVRAYFHLGWRNSVIGRYRINAEGDTSLARFAGYRAGPGHQLIEIRKQLTGA
jgi:branched-chain amino acid transport system substrate-binding protein